MNNLKEYNIKDMCPNCNKGFLEYIPEDEPWCLEHLMCNKCSSTYNLQTSDMKGTFVPYNERFKTIDKKE